MKGDYFTKDQRKEKADINSKTNFISPNGDGAFEQPAKRFEYGMQPQKEATDLSQMANMINDLKSHHFNMGKQSIPPNRSNDSYGLGVQSAKKPVKEPWATLKTNFTLGTDNMNKTGSDYTNRF